MEEKQKFTISVYTENNIGLLNRISAIFLKRHINIESLTVSKSEIEDVHRFTIVANMTEKAIKKILGQIEKQIEVIRAFYHTDDEVIFQETAMFKISTEHLYDEKIQNKLKLRHAHMVTINERYFVIETTGTTEDINRLYDRLKPYGLLQFVRSGRIAITKEKMAISELLQEFKD
ncbi:MAG: acetolactate synthase small subunit [Flavobacteriaceae bacterium]|nr:MAG: acetolactate synthase small subunit [Flavobacteriaceae bacterium]